MHSLPDFVSSTVVAYCNAAHVCYIQTLAFDQIRARVFNMEDYKTAVETVQYALQSHDLCTS